MRRSSTPRLKLENKIGTKAKSTHVYSDVGFREQTGLVVLTLSFVDHDPKLPYSQLVSDAHRTPPSGAELPSARALASSFSCGFCCGDTMVILAEFRGDHQASMAPPRLINSATKK